MAKNSLELRKELSLSEFYQLSQQVALNYAKSTASTARSSLMERYNLTESTFYTLLKMAITHHLVNDNIVQAIREKALANQSAHGNNGYNSTVKYNKLQEERNYYSAFTKKDIAYIASYYANHPDCSKKEASNIFHFHSPKVLDQILKKACMELIVTDKIFEALRKRAIANATNMDYTLQFFESLSQYRTEAKRNIKKKCHSAF